MHISFLPKWNTKKWQTSVVLDIFFSHDLSKKIKRAQMNLFPCWYLKHRSLRNLHPLSIVSGCVERSSISPWWYVHTWETINVVLLDSHMRNEKEMMKKPAKPKLENFCLEKKINKFSSHVCLIYLFTHPIYMHISSVFNQLD